MMMIMMQLYLLYLLLGCKQLGLVENLGVCLMDGHISATTSATRLTPLADSSRRRTTAKIQFQESWYVQTNRLEEFKVNWIVMLAKNDLLVFYCLMNQL